MLINSRPKLKPPIFLMHGDDDSVVPLEEMMEANRLITKIYIKYL